MGWVVLFFKNVYLCLYFHEKNKIYGEIEKGKHFHNQARNWMVTIPYRMGVISFISFFIFRAFFYKKKKKIPVTAKSGQKSFFKLNSEEKRRKQRISKFLMPEPVSVIVLSHSWKSKQSEKGKEMMREGRRQSPHILAGTHSDINKLKDRLINVRGFNRGHYDKRRQGEMPVDFAGWTECCFEIYFKGIKGIALPRSQAGKFSVHANYTFCCCFFFSLSLYDIYITHTVCKRKSVGLGVCQILLNRSRTNNK